MGGNAGAAAGSTGADDGSGRAMGRYMEEEQPLPADFFSIDDMKRQEDGSIRIVGCSGGQESVWESKDAGVSWEKIFDVPDEIPDDIRCRAMSSGGRVVYACDEIRGTDGKEAFYLVEPDGSSAQIPYELPKVEELNINLARQVLFVDDEQILICDDMGNFYLIRAADGSVERTFDLGDSGEVYVAFTAGKMLLFWADRRSFYMTVRPGSKKTRERYCRTVLRRAARFVRRIHWTGEKAYIISRRKGCTITNSGEVLWSSS